MCAMLQGTCAWTSWAEQAVRATGHQRTGWSSEHWSVLTSVCFRVRLVDHSKRGEVAKPRRERERVKGLYQESSITAGGQRTPMDFQKSAGEGTKNYFSTLFFLNDTTIITMGTSGCISGADDFSSHRRRARKAWSDYWPRQAALIAASSSGKSQTLNSSMQPLKKFVDLLTK